QDFARSIALARDLVVHAPRKKRRVEISERRMATQIRQKRAERRQVVPLNEAHHRRTWGNRSDASPRRRGGRVFPRPRQANRRAPGGPRLPPPRTGERAGRSARLQDVEGTSLRPPPLAHALFSRMRSCLPSSAKAKFCQLRRSHASPPS